MAVDKLPKGFGQDDIEAIRKLQKLQLTSQSHVACDAVEDFVHEPYCPPGIRPYTYHYIARERAIYRIGPEIKYETDELIKTPIWRDGKPVPPTQERSRRGVSGFFKIFS